MEDREEPGWSRSEWARWWIDHDEIDEAARALEAGDVLVVGKADFLDLSAALRRRGLVARYEDGAAFVYTATQEGEGDAATLDRRPPLRSTPAQPAHAKRSA